MTRRFKSLNSMPSTAAKSATKVVRLMVAGMVLFWLMFFLWLAIAAFFFITAALATGAIVVPIVALILFMAGHPVSGENFFGPGLGIPIVIGIVAGIIGSMGILIENQTASDVTFSIGQRCRKIAGLKPTDRHRYNW